jgi:hypothetical protein
MKCVRLNATNDKDTHINRNYTADSESLSTFMSENSKIHMQKT